LLRRTFYVPIGYFEKGVIKTTSMIGLIYGDILGVSPPVYCNEACILTASGKDLIDVVSANLESTVNKDISFGFVSSCIVRLETLGRHVYKVHDKLVKHFGDKPFIQVYVMGEDVYTKEIGPRRMADSFNTAIFYTGDSDGKN